MIVGVTGRKRSGKDTFASTLVEEFGFERLAFADPLKEYLLEFDPIVTGTSTTTRDYGYGGRLYVACGEPKFERLSEVVARLGWEAAKEILEVRRVLQGGTILRRFQEDFWVRATTSKIVDPEEDYVVTDARFPNEADALREIGGTVVRVNRPGLDGSDTHESETAMDFYPVDVEVANSGSLEDLARSARVVAANL